MIKRWTAKLYSWAGPWQKPRKNQKVKTRLVRAKTLEDLEKKLVKSKYRDFELIGERIDPGGFFSSQLKKRVEVTRAHLREERLRLRSYTVICKIELHARTPRQAASRAHALQRSSNESPRFEVTDSLTGITSTVVIKKRARKAKRKVRRRRGV